MKIITITAIAAVTIGLGACTDAVRGKLTSYGSAGRVTCHTAVGVYFDDFSTGKVARSADGADGFFFVSQTTRRLTEVTGDCVVDYGATPSATFKAVRP